MVSKLMPSAPASRIAISIRQATSRSVMPSTMVGQTSSMARSEASMAFWSITSSSESLKLRWSSVKSEKGTNSMPERSVSSPMAFIRLL